MARRVEAIVSCGLDGIVPQQRVASHKGSVTEITGPGHFLVFRGLVSFQVVDPSKGLAWTELTAEGHGLGEWVVDHDGAVLVPDHGRALSALARWTAAGHAVAPLQISIGGSCFGSISAWKVSAAIRAVVCWSWCQRER